MKAFATLYLRLDATTSSNAKLEALRDYFASAPAEDAAWAVYFLAGGARASWCPRACCANRQRHRPRCRTGSLKKATRQ